MAYVRNQVFDAETAWSSIAAFDANVAMIQNKSALQVNNISAIDRYGTSDY